MEITTIVLPEDKALKGRLERKLAEYRQRMQNASSLPEPKRTTKRTDSLYKSLLLETVLTDGSADVQAVKAQIVKAEGKVDEYCFKTAVDVIADYCVSGGLHNYGGTGI